MNIFIKGSLISAETVLPKGPLGSTTIPSYVRLASLIRTWLRDMTSNEKQAISEGNLWVELTCKMKAFLLVPCWALDPLTNQVLGHQHRLVHQQSNQLVDIHCLLLIYVSGE